ncbi:MAG TPA: type II toxin-antitoxin system RelE/ParE family toxin [Candidatus Hydrogenedentes bacterium]|nr:type II toxin-antitoxin system RelE/ParE family toxin [Candidatus Hydrogenedentota bacterium]
MRAVIRPLAVRDLEEQAAYIARDNPQAAVRFLDAARRTVDFLMRNPNVGGPRPAGIRLKDIRMWPVSRFERDLVFYRVVYNQLEVVRILHSARDIPGIFAEFSD